MHNIMLKLFGFLKSSTKFLKALIMILVTLFVLYWMQNLIGANWSWLGFITPFFKGLLEIAEKISSGSITLYKAVFEFKYLVALIFLAIAYIIVHFSYFAVEFLEDLYDSGRRIYKKIEEDALNRQLATEQDFEQKKLKNYQIYLQTFVKPAFAHRDYKVDIEEQNRILIKHLLEKTGICPNKYQEGFLYTFYSFDDIDNILDVFSKVKQSKAPIDFLICVQVIGQDRNVEIEELNTLIGLKILNKITALADTAYRYSFNENQRYETSQVGFYQKGQNDFEVHEFISKN